MKAICTICSRKKNDGAELIPARVRYAGDHIKTTADIAEESNLPFFILSGKYGLISSEEKIPDYDYYLEEQAVDSLAQTVAKQLKERDITELVLHTEGKDSWKPYDSVLQKATELAEVTLQRVSI
ncbi:MAG: hypothetical protein JKX80_00680 [Candidatus Pacebacteria bacterium]|nr:hypothetical protein [Candidatus Paceibacterota bacterium]